MAFLGFDEFSYPDSIRPSGVIERGIGEAIVAYIRSAGALVGDGLGSRRMDCCFAAAFLPIWTIAKEGTSSSDALRSASVRFWASEAEGSGRPAHPQQGRPWPLVAIIFRSHPRGTTRRQILATDRRCRHRRIPLPRYSAALLRPAAHRRRPHRAGLLNCGGWFAGRCRSTRK